LDTPGFAIDVADHAPHHDGFAFLDSEALGDAKVGGVDAHVEALAGPAALLADLGEVGVGVAVVGAVGGFGAGGVVGEHHPVADEGAPAGGAADDALVDEQAEGEADGVAGHLVAVAELLLGRELAAGGQLAPAPRRHPLPHGHPPGRRHRVPLPRPPGPTTATVHRHPLEQAIAEAAPDVQVPCPPLDGGPERYARLGRAARWAQHHCWGRSGRGVVGRAGGRLHRQVRHCDDPVGGRAREQRRIAREELTTTTRSAAA
jgi:hypothetical protein